MSVDVEIIRGIEKRIQKATPKGTVTDNRAACGPSSQGEQGHDGNGVYESADSDTRMTSPPPGEFSNDFQQPNNSMYAGNPL